MTKKLGLLMNSQNNTSTILIVDSEPNELKALVIGFKLEGFEAVGVSSSKEALSILRERDFDAALIDLMMPEMNGLQLARAMRTSAPNLRTILMSAYHLSPVQLARADTGAVGFVPKPFLFDDLVSFIISKTSSDARLAVDVPPIHAVKGTGLHVPFDVPKTA